MDENDCVADFTLRSKTRLTYPGACSLEYQNIKKIVIETLLQWDCKKQKSKGKGILGTTRAFAPGDEEQGRGTLHSHWQVFIEELNNDVRIGLFQGSKAAKDKARQTIIAHIDKVMDASYGDGIQVTHKCNPSRKGTVDQIFQQCDLQILRNARHKNLCNDVRGKILECKECKELLTTTDIINNALQHFRVAHKQTRSETMIPLSPKRLDIAAYTYSYHMQGGCHPIKDEFWGDEKLRRLLLKLRFEEHSWSHRRSCFKKVRHLPRTQLYFLILLYLTRNFYNLRKFFG